MGVAWVNGHWLQIAIAIGAGLVIYLLLSLLRRIALKHAQSTEGDMTLTHIAGRVIHKTKSLVLAIIAVRLVAPGLAAQRMAGDGRGDALRIELLDRKSTRLNSSH